MILQRFLRKQTFFVFLLTAVSVLLSCQKDPRGDMIVKIRFTDQTVTRNKKRPEQSFYSQFGDHIVSLTPSEFSVRIAMIRFFDNVPFNQDGAHIFDISTFSDLMLPADSPERDFSFTENQSVNVTPALIGQKNEDGYYSMESVEFIILQFGITHFFQEIILPAEYSQISLDQFNFEWNGQTYICDSLKTGNILRVDYIPILAELFSLDQGTLSNFYFGNTDTTQMIVLSNTISSYPGLEPAGDIQGRFVWSNFFSKWKLNRPATEQTASITIEMIFDVQDLIQIYAGIDNEPYTTDDIIVYAPEFWNRLSVYVTSTTQ